MNAILNKVVEARNGHYCHAVEVSDRYELECIAESITSEFEDEHDEETIIDFLETLEVYCLDAANEEEVFNFSFREYIQGTI